MYLFTFPLMQKLDSDGSEAEKKEEGTDCDGAEDALDHSEGSETEKKQDSTSSKGSGSGTPVSPQKPGYFSSWFKWS